jgi:hypothetical protein
MVQVRPGAITILRPMSRARRNFWTSIRMVRERMSQDAPDGKVARVTVGLHSGESFTPDVVSIERELPWLWFEVVDRPEEPRRVIVVQEGAIAKVDISFISAGEGGPIGFDVQETSDAIAAHEPTGEATEESAPT